MIYLDNSSTSFPKAPGVAQAMKRFIDDLGVNVSRGAYQQATEAGLVVTKLRKKIAHFFDFDSPAHVVFTPGQTFSLNLLIRGLVRPGDRVVVTSFEHNAVMRPLYQQQATIISLPPAKGGCQKTPVAAPSASLAPRAPAVPPAALRGALPDTPSAALSDAPPAAPPAALSDLITDETRLVIATHASNVTGALQPVDEIARLCAERNVPFVLDAAQTAGHIPISCAELPLAALCVSGHKGMLGPQGIAALLLSDDLARTLEPLISGGTGSASSSETQPEFLPDKFEAGTPNLPGIFGLDAALDFLVAQGIETIQAHERACCTHLLEGLAKLDSSKVRLVGPGSPWANDRVGAAEPGGSWANDRVGVFSFDFPGQDVSELAFALEQDYEILVRSGLHCALAAHKALGTFPQGTLRVSFSFATSHSEIDTLLEAFRQFTA